MKKKYPIIIAAVTAVMFSASEFFFSRILKLMIDRDGLNMKKYVRRHKPEELIPDDKDTRYTQWMDSQNFEKITITSYDGLRLVGHYLAAGNAKRTMLMMHGWRGTWKGDFAAMAKEFYERGCNLLLIEERAQGESEGRYIGFGIEEKEDCTDWVSYLVNERKEQLPIYLVGVSMGASTVLMAAGSDKLNSQVKGVIADCGFTSPYNIVTKVAKSVFHVGKHTVNIMNRRCRKRAGYGLDDYSATEAMEDCRIPVFFAHGKKDGFVPYEMTLENYEACVASKHLLLVEDADHCECFTKETERYLNELWEFFGWEGNDNI